MKRITKILLLGFLSTSSLLSACNSSQDINIITPSSIECRSHYDNNNDGFCDRCSTPVEPKKEFTNVVFNDKTFVYDGQPHSIEVSNLPAGAGVSYEGNEKVDIGTYTVTATISAPGYNNKVLQAKMTIEGSFSGLVFRDLTIPYDGKSHSIYVENVPSFATVTYSGNGVSTPGTHTVTATIKATGYQTAQLSAKIIITNNQITGVTFNDQTFDYDGKYHSLAVSNLPSYASVTYSSNNSQSEPGEYRITATIKASGYQTLTLYATMKIVKRLPNMDFPDRTLIYDGADQLITVTLPRDLPRNTDVIYIVDGKTCETINDFRVKTLGVHTASVTLKNDTYKYTPSTFTAKITVINNTIGGIDSSKNAFKITSDLKYKTLKSEILKGNFTAKYEIFDDYFYPDGRKETTVGAVQTVYVSNGEAFFIYDSAPRDKIYSEYNLYESYYTHTKIVGDEVLSVTFEDGVFSAGGYDTTNRYPKEYYAENVLGGYGLRCMAYVKESSNGGFENDEEGGYTTTYGSFKIDSINNAFVTETVNHYYHPEFNHDERVVYTIFNIGNTKINMIDAFNLDNINKSDILPYRYRINGFEYYINTTSNEVTATTEFDALSVTFLEKGEYTMPHTVSGLPVKKLTTGYYSKYHNHDCEGYVIKTYFDQYGNYKGPVENLGYVSNMRELNVFLDDGGEVLYYGEW